MLTATSSPTTAFLINGIDRAERYCASRSAIGSCDLTTRPEVPHMATRDEGGQTRANRQSEEVEEVEDLDSSDLQERQEKLGEDVDDILDEIDSVLEENAEDFVRQYVQKGGGGGDRLPPVSEKPCPDGEQVKPLSYFPRNARRRDGHGLY